MDLVSIIVPIYNTKKYLRKCIDSILKQTYKNIEILLINDGSLDDSDKIMEKYKLKDKRVKCFYKKNSGLSDTRNYGIKKAQGKYLCFVDSDDWISECYVEKLLKAVKENNSQIAVCEFDRVYDDKVTKNNINELDIKGFKVPAAWNKIYLKEIIDKYDLKFPKGKWYEDLNMTSRYIMLCDKIAIVKDSLYFYRQNNNSIMHTYDERIFQIYDALNDIESFSKEKKVYEKNRQEIEFANVYHALIGTLFRASFMSGFNVELIKKIVFYVEKKYPTWYNNKVVRQNLSLVYKIFLVLIKYKMYKLIFFLLKQFNKYMYL